MMKTAVSALVLLLLACAQVAQAKVYFEERFDKTWTDRWVNSDWRESDGMAGKWTWSAGEHYADAEEDKGIKTGPDAKFFAISAPLTENFESTKGKDLVIQMSVKHEQQLDCGGGYIKVIPSKTAGDMSHYDNETPYHVMFGPDICGSTNKRVHVILPYKGKNYLINKTIAPKTDTLTHVYTLIISPDNTYKVLIDNVEVEGGSIEEDWAPEMLGAKEIPDPEASKPDDWDERPTILDENDVKPEGYDDIPEKIVDASATKPDDWDDEDDGDWEAPLMDNPEYKGPWKQKVMDNPDYQGEWVHPMIPNPEYVSDPNLYLIEDIGHVGFELWQVKAGTIFDNILITDDVAYAKQFALDTWGKMKDIEKSKVDEVKAKKDAEMEERRRQMEEEQKAQEEEDEEDEEDDEDEEEEEEEEDDEDADDDVHHEL